MRVVSETSPSSPAAAAVPDPPPAADRDPTNGELAAVQLPPQFDIGTLKGKTAVQQVQSILEARRAWVEGRLRVLQAEKALLDRAGPLREPALGASR